MQLIKCGSSSADAGFLFHQPHLLSWRALWGDSIAPSWTCPNRTGFAFNFRFFVCVANRDHHGEWFWVLRWWIECRPDLWSHFPSLRMFNQFFMVLAKIQHRLFIQHVSLIVSRRWMHELPPSSNWRWKIERNVLFFRDLICFLFGFASPAP